eukprot:4438883-Alexandrium_andersonii.AAC.1
MGARRPALQLQSMCVHALAFHALPGRTQCPGAASGQRAGTCSSVALCSGVCQAAERRHSCSIDAVPRPRP